MTSMIITQSVANQQRIHIKLVFILLTLNRASVGIYARTVLYCTALYCTLLYSTVQSLTLPQIQCVRLCENLKVLGLV